MAKKLDRYLKDIATLTIGSIVAQAIVVLCSPIITRIYSPEDIGLYTYILAIISTFTAIINFRYDMAIVSEENEKMFLL